MLDIIIDIHKWVNGHRQCIEIAALCCACVLYLAKGVYTSSRIHCNSHITISKVLRKGELNHPKVVNRINISMLQQHTCILIRLNSNIHKLRQDQQVKAKHLNIKVIR